MKDVEPNVSQFSVSDLQGKSLWELKDYYEYILQQAKTVKDLNVKFSKVQYTSEDKIIIKTTNILLIELATNMLEYWTDVQSDDPKGLSKKMAYPEQISYDVFNIMKIAYLPEFIPSLSQTEMFKNEKMLNRLFFDGFLP